MAMAGAERLFRMLDQKPGWQDAADARALPIVRGRVEFQSVNFEYQPGRPVLTDISFAAEPGQSVALVGHTGSGKTTLVGLLQKFYLPVERTCAGGRHGLEFSHGRFAALADGQRAAE